MIYARVVIVDEFDVCIPVMPGSGGDVAGGFSLARVVFREADASC